jgi:hypothetical protein
MKVNSTFLPSAVTNMPWGLVLMMVQNVGWRSIASSDGNERRLAPLKVGWFQPPRCGTEAMDQAWRGKRRTARAAGAVWKCIKLAALVSERCRRVKFSVGSAAP